MVLKNLFLLTFFLKSKKKIIEISSYAALLNKIKQNY